MELKHCTLNELLNNDFHLFTYDEKCKSKNKKPTPYLLIEYKNGKFTRTFQSVRGLVVVINVTNVFCFINVFFRGEK
jgi:hypothetical protein